MQQGQTIPTYPNYHPRACWKSSISFFSSWYAGLKEHCWHTVGNFELAFDFTCGISPAQRRLILLCCSIPSGIFPRLRPFPQLRRHFLTARPWKSSKFSTDFQPFPTQGHTRTDPPCPSNIEEKTQNSTLDSMLICNQPDPVWRNMKLYNLLCLAFTLLSCTQDVLQLLLSFEHPDFINHGSQLHYLPLSSCSPSEPVPPKKKYIQFYQKKTQLLNFWGSPHPPINSPSICQ